MSGKKKQTVTLQGEPPVAPEPIAATPEQQAAMEYDEQRSAFHDANVADKALKANTTEFPGIEEPNMPHDREVLQNYTAPEVVTTDNGLGRVEGTEPKEPSKEVVLPENIQAAKEQQ